MPDSSFRAFSTAFHFTLRLKYILLLSFFSQHWRKAEECVFEHIDGITILALCNLIEIAPTDNVDNTTFHKIL